MLVARQRLLLSLLDALGGTAPKADFQHLLLLFTTEGDPGPSYEFVPLRSGAFSFTSDADQRRLTARGLLAHDDQHWVLTKPGRAETCDNPSLRSRLIRFAHAHSELRGDALAAEVYRRHPWYATRCPTVERLLPTATDRARIAAAKPAPPRPGLVTIGYEGRSLENYLNALLRDSVTLLCDVRRNPLSRKWGFSKTTLRQACEAVGLRYEHLPELGIASAERRELRAQSDYDSLFAVYERDTLPRQTAALEGIRAWIECAGERVALTCFEAQPERCHRRCVAEALQRLAGPRLQPHHL